MSGLTDEQVERMASRLAGVCDGDVSEAARWLAPVVADLIREARAEALREAADEAPWWEAIGWLRDRAHRIEEAHDAD